MTTVQMNEQVRDAEVLLENARAAETLAIAAHNAAVEDETRAREAFDGTPARDDLAAAYQRASLRVGAAKRSADGAIVSRQAAERALLDARKAAAEGVNAAELQALEEAASLKTYAAIAEPALREFAKSAVAMTKAILTIADARKSANDSLKKYLARGGAKRHLRPLVSRLHNSLSI